MRPRGGIIGYIGSDGFVYQSLSPTIALGVLEVQLHQLCIEVWNDACGMKSQKLQRGVDVMQRDTM